MNKKFLVTSGATLAAVGALFLNPLTASAHCDTMDGPVIGDAQKAVEENNVNYIAKWVGPEAEAELTEVFNQTMEVRDDSPEAQKLADQYLFENLVRIHRSGEGAPYTGVKPEGFPMAEEIMAADKSIEAGSLEPLEELVEPEKIPELKESLSALLATKDFDTDDVAAGREYIMNYVTFTHLAEGEEHEEEGHGAAEHDDVALADDLEATLSEKEGTTKAAGETDEEEVQSLAMNWLPWGLAGVFFLTTIAGIKRRKA